MSVQTLTRERRWAPGVSARIDWSHPISRGLTGFWLAAGDGFVNLVNPADALARVGSTNFSNAASSFGPASGGAGAGVDYGLTTPSSGLKPANGHSLLWVGNVLGNLTGTNPVLFGIAYDNVDGSPFAGAYMYRNSNTAVTAATNNGSFASVAGTPAAMNGSHIAVQTYDGAALSLHWDGLRIGTTAVSGTTTYGATAQVVMNTPTLNQSRSTNSTATAAGIWSRALTAAEIALLTADPFCFLLDPSDFALAVSATTPAAGGAVLEGSTGVTFANSGALTTDIPLAGSSSLAFADTAALTTSITMAGTSAIRFATTGSLDARSIGTVQYRFGRIRKRYEFGQITKEPT